MFIAWALACTGPEQVDPSVTTSETTTTTTVTTDTVHTGDSGTTPTTTPTTTYDCSQPLPTPQLVRHHDYIVSSEDFTFDEEGYLWGVATSHGGLIRTPLDGNDEMMLPNVSSWGRGVRILGPGGDIVIAEPDRGALVRVDRNTMGTTIVTGGFNQPNGLAVGLDGFVQLTQSSGDVMRINPDTGEQTLLHHNPVTNDGIVFGPDFRQLYWNSEGGAVATLRLDETGAVEEAASLVGSVNGFLDGMTSDACGNLYVVVMFGKVVRMLPDGTQHTVVDVSSHPDSFISAVNFGSGVGGWERDHLYIMSLSRGVFEVDIGIPGKLEPHLR